MLGTLFQKHWVKLHQPFSQHARDQQVFAYYCSFEWLMLTYDCKQVPVDILYVVKMAEVVLLNIFRIGFPASPFTNVHNFNKTAQLWAKQINVRQSSIVFLCGDLAGIFVCSNWAEAGDFPILFLSLMFLDWSSCLQQSIFFSGMISDHWPFPDLGQPSFLLLLQPLLLPCSCSWPFPYSYPCSSSCTCPRIVKVSYNFKYRFPEQNQRLI